MKILTRPLAFIALTMVAALLLSSLLVVGSALAAPPVTVAVDVKDEGLRLWIPVPSLWLTAAARLLPVEERVDELDAGQRRVVAQVQELITAVGRAGDTLLVHVETGSETVLVAKRNRHFTVSVRSAEADVDVAVPVSTLKSLARGLST